MAVVTRAITMTRTDSDLDVLLKIISVSKTKRDAIKHVIMFARNDVKRNRKRTLDEYADLIEQIVYSGPTD